jgi:hypothetical protein
VLDRAGAGLGRRALGRREQPLGEARTALERPLQAVDLEQVDAHPVIAARCRPPRPQPPPPPSSRAARRYSTVTVLARLRGLIDVEAAQASYVVGQQLQRDDRQDRLQHPVRARDVDRLLGVRRPP